MNRFAKQISLVLAAALLVLAIDQSVKRLVVGAMHLGESHTLLPGILDISYHQNTGAAFSILHDAPAAVLILLNLVVLGIFVFLIYPHLSTRWGVISAALITGGALGNLLDRIRLHYVVDFFDLHVWPVFNIADMAIVIGVMMLVVVIVMSERKNRLSSSGGARS
ncbi:MAG TPA: signal peptidase II [Armatimonadota bacterium]|nr:signal peptidase II [Armatimonadota bacterium]